MTTHIIAYSFMIILLAAHFSRGGNNILALITLLIPFLFLVKRKWIIGLLQGVAYLSTLVWLVSAYQLIQLRIAAGHDWIRLAIIIFTVAVYSAWTGYFLQTRKTKEG